MDKKDLLRTPMLREPVDALDGTSPTDSEHGTLRAACPDIRRALRRRGVRAFSGGALILFLALAGLPSAAAGKTILVFAPHPDDEAIIAAGRVRAGLNRSDSVKIVVVTNGDVSGVATGLRREGESVAAAQVLGLTENDVIFLGYPDGSMLNIYNASSPTQVFTSAAGQTSTYGNRGLGSMDYHSYRYGSPGPYNHVTVAGDIQALLTTYPPDEIYTTSNFDTHTDHQATALFLKEALVSMKRSGSALSTQLYESIVWPPAQGNWPDVGGCAPSVPFPPPPMNIQLDWNRLLRFVVPAEMQSTDPTVNLKCRVITQYQSQLTPWLLSFARKDEFFWLSDFGANLAITAQVTVSSENTANNQGGLNAVDGVIDGAPHDPAREWVTLNQLSGAWIQLSWPSSVSIAQVNLYDRPHWSENVLAGTLSFSDGTSISVGALPPNGNVLPVTFPPKTVTWVRFTVNQAEGTATGLSEIQVLGLPATATANVAPYFIQGPAPSADRIHNTETATFLVAANDLNGDAVQYQWSADGGAMQASGTTAVFRPPAVSASTVFTITSRIVDARGASNSNVGFVTVMPAADALSVAPTSVIGGDSAQGTVSLANAAPSGGLTVPLSSSDPSASVPASVTVPAGNFSANFTVTTATVTTATRVTLSANINGTSQTAALVVVNAPSNPNLLLSSDSIGDANWGNWGTMTTTLNYATAPDGTQHATRAVVTQPGGHALVQQATVAANTSYTFSFYARNNGGSAASYSVYDFTHGADIVPSTPYISTINNSTWTQVSVTFTTPAGCTSVNVYLLRDSGYPVDILLWRATLTANQTPPSLTAAMTAAPNPVFQGNPLTVTLSVTNSGQGTADGVAPSGFTVGGAGATCSASSTPASANIAGGATQLFTWACTAGNVGTATFSAGATGIDANSGATVSAAAASTSVTIQRNPPTITSFTPASGLVGASVTINGANFTGATAVSFNTVSAIFAVTSDSAIQATVPAGAATGPLSVTTPTGTATSTNNFTVRVILTAANAGNGSGTVTSSSNPASPSQINCGATCLVTYDYGTVMTLTATPAIGSNFTSWSGCDTVSGPTCTVTMNANKSVTATFTLQTFILTVNKAHVLIGNGTVTSTSSPASPNQVNCGPTCSVSYNYGTVVTLTARPDLLSVFNGWSGGCDTASGTTCTVNISAAKSVTANFLP